ncbi:proliferating cellular nuclear antigen 1-like [Tripterygium wilfordii]|uniref:proliferating cellular nuclear antigen 1-like n=1 Tax=Tripterygium wilfordii TaxID=458696 RepID=UPI0018F845E4|nr:proliferating cellular nuclear antigen 1-like [Tripterygium wilfordii]XP_038680899.1 proliferating cellular nuclear antigen 1-like [Tripterygium wilfordii]
MATGFFVVSSWHLLWEAVAPILNLTKKATINCTQSGLTVIASDPDWTVVMVLEIERTKFNVFSCLEGFSFGMNLEEFYKMMSKATNEEIITIFGDAREVKIGVSGPGYFGYRLLISREETLDELDIQHLTVLAAEYSYHVSVGIRRNPFRRAMTFAHQRRATEVTVTITNTQVSFSTEKNEEMIVDTPGEFAIQPPITELINPVQIKFSLRRMSSYLRASLMTEAVWLFDSVDSGTMMLCPSSVGDFMYIFQTPRRPKIKLFSRA